MIEIEVQVLRRSSRGEVWGAVLPDGQAVESRTPFFAAARALLAAGVDPATTLAMRHHGSTTVAMRSTVGEAAKWTVREEPNLALEMYKEHPGSDGLAAPRLEAKTGPSRPRPVWDTGVAPDAPL